MGEKRKACFTIHLRKEKKTLKIELFHKEDFEEIAKGEGTRYRVRADGRWYKTKEKVIRMEFFTWDEVWRLLQRSISAP